jgi:protein phosphatase PTC7
MRAVLRNTALVHPGRRWASSAILSKGTKTPLPEEAHHQTPKSPFYFDTGYALYAKRPSRAFPPPFVSPPSGSFSDRLSTHNQSRDRRSYVNGEMIRGITNGDDAVLAQENFIGANDGVGAWATRERGHAALWSRLILHFWALEAERDSSVSLAASSSSEPNPVEYLQKAYQQTITATSSPNKWNGTTTACAALLHYRTIEASDRPILYVTNLGDSQCLVVRPRDETIVYKTTEQWHWFDCPRQLGTNSPDTPNANAVMDKVDIEENDVVLAMSDGVVDNLWEHEVVQNVLDSIHKWEAGEGGDAVEDRAGGAGGGMLFVAEELVKAARIIAEDPYAESPFMERAVEEGLAREGG